jgi:hypothetical protein
MELGNIVTVKQSVIMSARCCIRSVLRMSVFQFLQEHSKSVVP